MLTQTMGQIFPSAERGHSETDSFRSYNSFNFGSYQHDHKAAIGSLYVFNDDTLAAGKSFTLTVEEDSTIIIIPTVGAVAFKDNKGSSDVIVAGQAVFLHLLKGTAIEYSNPCESGLINFLQLWLRNPQAEMQAGKPVDFDLVLNRNKLVNLFPSVHSFKTGISKCAGREELEYFITENNKAVFAFVLEGAFEVQNRLLENRDGLALWNTKKIELEALSNDAIILFLEFPF